MATDTTSNINLELPKVSDYVDINVINANMTRIDSMFPDIRTGHNNLCRHKVLTDTYSLSDIYQMITNQDYRDIYAGDIIKVDMPAISRTGFTATTAFPFYVAQIGGHKLVSQPHLILIPVTHLGQAKMHDASMSGLLPVYDPNAGEGLSYDYSNYDEETSNIAMPYYWTSMHQVIMPAVDSALEYAFGTDHVLNVNELICTQLESSSEIDPDYGVYNITKKWGYYPVKARCMTDLEIYGDDGRSIQEGKYSNITDQLSIFKVDRDTIFLTDPSDDMNREVFYWTSSVMYNTSMVNGSRKFKYYTCVSGYSYNDPGYGLVNELCYVRPRFLIG